MKRSWGLKSVCALLCAVLALGVCAVTPDQALAFDENPMPYWIHVSRVGQIVSVMSTADDSCVRQMICSTGLPSSPTIKGRFRMPKARSDERRNWYAFSAGGSTYGHYATRITGSYLFHSILYSRAATSALKRDTWNLLGSKASHGCVRMTPLDAQWIAYNCAPGTLVVIDDKAAPGPIKAVRTIKATLPKPNSNGSLPGFEPTLTPTPKPGPAEVPTLSLGIVGPRTKAMQTSLRYLGYYGGTVNGKFGEDTQLALERFQLRYLAINPSTGLLADGRATPQWQEIITQNKTNPDCIGHYRALKQGAAGLSVKALKQRLLDFHYTTAPVSTTFDERTKLAVGNAQRAYGLKVNGVADEELQGLLFADGAKPLPFARANIRGGLSLRRAQSTRASVVVKVKDGTKLAVVKFYGDWSYVTVGKSSGYVLSRYLVYENPAEDPATAA